MKTTIRNIATGTFIALLLLVGNVKASETEVTSLKATETTLQLENWMTNETIWNNKTTTIMNVALEAEATLELENWMTNAESWNVYTNFVNEVESGLEMEDWMTNDATWNKENTNIEPALTVEPWMTDSNLWK